VTADEIRLEPAITLPADALSVTIGADGTVSVTQPGQTQATQVGMFSWPCSPTRRVEQRRQQFVFKPPPHLAIRLLELQVAQKDWARCQQGFVEQSNVDVVQEICGNDSFANAPTSRTRES